MKRAKIFQALNYWPTHLVLKFFVRFEVRGQQNLCGLENEAIILTSNHCSRFDGPIAAASLPRASLFPEKFFPIRFLVMERFFHWKYQKQIPFELPRIRSRSLRQTERTQHPRHQIPRRRQIRRTIRCPRLFLTCSSRGDEAHFNSKNPARNLSPCYCHNLRYNSANEFGR
jgi:hypothetical protein